MPFGLFAGMVPMNHALDGSGDPPWKGAILRERGTHCEVSAVSSAKTAKPIDLPFGCGLEWAKGSTSSGGAPPGKYNGAIRLRR